MKHNLIGANASVSSLTLTPSRQDVQITGRWKMGAWDWGMGLEVRAVALKDRPEKVRNQNSKAAFFRQPQKNRAALGGFELV